MPRQFLYKIMVRSCFLLLLIFLMIPVARSQNSYGIVAGGGITMLKKIPGSIENFSRYSSHSSFWGGFNARFALGESGFFLSPSLLYSRKGYHYKMQNDAGAINTIRDSSFIQDLNYGSLNVLLLKKFSLDERAGFFIGAGPELNVFISGKEKTTANYFGSMPGIDITKSNLQTGSQAGNYKRLYPTIGLVAGAEFGRFSLWVNYNIPLDYYYLDSRKKLQHSLKSFGVSASFTLFSSNHAERERKVREPKEHKEKKEKATTKIEPVKIDSLADGDGDGIPDYKDQCPGHKGTAKYGGCPVPDSDGDGVNDDADKCPFVEGPVSNYGCPEFKEPEVPVSKDTLRFIIYFEQAKSDLKTNGFNTLNEVVRLMKANPRLVAQFSGHTDSHGSVEANSIRAFSRASVCADYVASYFIERHRLIVAAYSNRAPVADLRDPSVQWKNRRVEVILYEK